MATTPVYGFHYPSLGDAPDVPQWVQDLAEDLETKIAAMDATVALMSQLPVTIRKTANESVTSSTTLQADNHFAFAVAANSVYALTGYLIYDGAGDAGTGQGGLKMQFTGPAGSSMTWTNFGTNVAIAAPNTLLTYNVVAESLAAGSPRSVGTNTVGPSMTCIPHGTLVTAGTSGTLQFLWAQNTSNAAATTVKTNSWMTLTKIT